MLYQGYFEYVGGPGLVYTYKPWVEHIWRMKYYRTNVHIIDEILPFLM